MKIGQWKGTCHSPPLLVGYKIPGFPPIKPETEDLRDWGEISPKGWEVGQVAGVQKETYMFTMEPRPAFTISGMT